MIVLLALAGLLLAAPAWAQESASGEPLTVALTGKYPPFSFYDNAGELAGFDVDVSTAIARRLGRPVEIKAVEWDGILPGLLAGQYDTIIGSMADTPARREQVNFTRPYYLSGAQLFVHRDMAGDIASIDDAAGKRIGVVVGETYQHFLENHCPDVTVVTYQSSVNIFEDVKAGRLAGFVTDRLVGSHQVKQANQPFLPAGEMLYKEKIAIPVRKGDTELLAGINAALDEMEASGELAGIHDKWFGLQAQNAAPDTGMSAEVVIRKLATGFAITLGVAGASLAVGFLLAVPIGALLNRSSGLATWAARGVVDFIRGTPVLVQLFFVYYGGPRVGLQLSPMTAAVLTLSVNSMAYMSEVVRSGLMSVDQGQMLAGRALGLSRLKVFRLIIWPQAFRIALPPLMNSVVALTKDTALISVIAVPEVVNQARSIISVTFDPIKYWFIVAVMFFCVTFPLMKLAGYVERRIRQKGYVND